MNRPRRRAGILVLAAYFVASTACPLGEDTQVGPDDGRCFRDRDCRDYQVCFVPPIPREAGSDDAAAGRDASLRDDAGAAANVKDASIDADAGTQMDGGTQATDTTRDGGMHRASAPTGFCICSTKKCGIHSFCDQETKYGECVEPICRSNKDCGKGEACTLGRCFDLNGACESEDDCEVPGTIKKTFTMDCTKTCRILVDDEALVYPAFYKASRVLQLYSPGRWDELTQGKVRFSWEAPPDGAWSMLIVTDRLVTERLAAAAKWVAYIPNDGSQDPVSTARWADGFTVENGEAVAQSVPLVPGSYYAFALHIREGKVEAASVEVPFRIDSTWPNPGLPCDTRKDIFADCRHPDRPQGCIDGECRVLCASHADCIEYVGGADPAFCGVPNANGYRVCSKPGP